jgi:predicted transcriptional regulator
MLEGRFMKRNKDEIISEILSICINGAGKTRIVYQANLNFKTIEPYLQLLIKNNLVEVRQDKHVLYETTEKGTALLRAINQIQNDLSETKIIGLSPIPTS